MIFRFFRGWCFTPDLAHPCTILHHFADPCGLAFRKPNQTSSWSKLVEAETVSIFCQNLAAVYHMVWAIYPRISQIWPKPTWQNTSRQFEDGGFWHRQSSELNTGKAKSANSANLANLANSFCLARGCTVELFWTCCEVLCVQRHVLDKMQDYASLCKTKPAGFTRRYHSGCVAIESVSWSRQ